MTDIKKKKKGNSQVTVWIVSASIMVVVLFLCTIGVKKIISGDESTRRRQIQMIKLLEPQAPPKKIEEKPPEPEEQKEVKQEIQEVMQEQLIQESSQPDESNSDEPPAGQDLGLDADGSAGSDGFGLVGKKGGRSLIGSGSGGDGSGGSSLMQKYGWYIQKVQDSIREYLKKEFEKDGGIPEGNLQATLRIVLDEQGRISKFNILGSSGSNKMDNAIEAVIKLIDIDDPPPDGMPKAIKIRVSSKG